VIADPSGSSSDLIRRHLYVGWTWLLVFLILGGLLEAFHGFKIGWYVDVDNATRRLMWTLAHAHGVLLGLVNLGFALTVYLRPSLSRVYAVASACLVGASLLLPGGFFLGGLVIYEGDPGLGVYLTPAGALLLAAAVVAILRGLGGADQAPTRGGRHDPSRPRSGEERRT
jgi:hypothetical protein